MRGDGRGRSRGAEVVLGAARRTGPERGVHREMVRDVDALGGIWLARMFWDCSIVGSTH